MPRPAVVALKRKEWIADIQLPLNNVQVALPTQGGQLPNDRFMWGIELQFEGRITNAGANNPTGTQADGQFALLDTIIVQGNHRVRGNFEQFINARGPDLRELYGLYNGRFNFNQNALATGINATSDIRFSIVIPFVPLNVSIGQQIDYLLDAPNYDSLKLLINYGDDQSVFTYAARTAPTFSAFGSAVGNPRIRVYGYFTQFGQGSGAGFVPARVFRYFDEQANAATLVNSTAGARIHNIPRGNILRALLQKTGVKSAAVAAGNSSYTTLSNGILTGNIKIMRGVNRQVRLWQDYFAMREESASVYAITPDNGYALVDWALNGSVREALNLRGAIVGSTGDIDVYEQADTTGAAGQSSLALWEELRFDPQYPQ